MKEICGTQSSGEEERHEKWHCSACIGTRIQNGFGSSQGHRAGTPLLKEKVCGSHTHPETWMNHQPGMWLFAELHLATIPGPCSPTRQSMISISF